MRNIVCMTVRRLKDNASKEYNKNLSNLQTFKLYQAMAEIVAHSAKHFISEDFDVHLIEGDVDSYQEIFHKNFKAVHDLWTEDGPNNILYLDNDTLVTAPLDVFGKYPDFQMFNYTDPKRLSGDCKTKNKYGLDFEHYLNAGCRYYPSTMQQSSWDLGWEYANDWDYGIWGTEQLIFNHMMYTQNPDHNHWIDPTMNYQVMSLPHQHLDNDKAWQHFDEWNGCSHKDAKVMHLHGTRGAANTLITQWLMWKKITGEEFQFKDISISKDAQGNPVSLELKQ